MIIKFNKNDSFLKNLITNIKSSTEIEYHIFIFEKTPLLLFYVIIKTRKDTRAIHWSLILYVAVKILLRIYKLIKKV